MKELNFWNVDPPHLHGFFESKKGEFRLLPDGKGGTWLRGRTWYVHNIRPVAYWKTWSDQIVHQVHRRVLSHMKKMAEAEAVALPATQ
jgi:hypothetical protein